MKMFSMMVYRVSQFVLLRIKAAENQLCKFKYDINLYGVEG